MPRKASLHVPADRESAPREQGGEGEEELFLKQRALSMQQMELPDAARLRGKAFQRKKSTVVAPDVAALASHEAEQEEEDDEDVEDEMDEEDEVLLAHSPDPREVFANSLD